MGSTETVADRIRRRMKIHAELPPPAERRALREASGLTQEEVAEAVGVTRQAISQWESGVRTPQGTLLHRYAEALRTLQEA